MKILIRTSSLCIFLLIIANLCQTYSWGFKLPVRKTTISSIRSLQSRQIRHSPTVVHSTNTNSDITSTIAASFFQDVIPFVSEHVQKSDQLLIIGGKTDFALQMAADGYGMSKLGFITVIDPSAEAIQQLQQQALSRPDIASQVGHRLKFAVANLDDLGSICRQSSFDAVVDYGGLDELVRTGRRDSFLKCIDYIQQSLRLGNLLLCLSKYDKETFCPPFEERFGMNYQLMFSLICSLRML